MAKLSLAGAELSLPSGAALWVVPRQRPDNGLLFSQFLIVPAIVGSALLHLLSDDRWEKITAWMYGVGLCALFIVSTVFHIVSWKKSHLR